MQEGSGSCLSAARRPQSTLTTRLAKRTTPPRAEGKTIDEPEAQAGLSWHPQVKPRHPAGQGDTGVKPISTWKPPGGAVFPMGLPWTPQNEGSQTPLAIR
jgi:hypothetical protein